MLEKHLEILREQKSVTSDAVEKTMLEGATLIDYLRETNARNELGATNSNSENPPLVSQTSVSKQVQNSHLHLEGKWSGDFCLYEWSCCQLEF